MAALAPRTEGSSQSFFTWFNYKRMFQFNTWGHLVLIALFLALELIPALLGSLIKILRLLLGTKCKAAVLSLDEGGKTFQQAIEDGTIRVCKLAITSIQLRV